MAFKHQLILWAAVMLAILAAASASVGDQCVPGLVMPHNPLGACRTYVVSQICHVGPRLFTWDMKRRCCDELLAIPAYCRCEALRILMDGVVTPQGVFEGGYLKDMPNCPRVTQRSYAATLVAPHECNLHTIHGSPYCPTLQAGYGVVF
uniref:Trypsin inhibitor n=1 Tax=Triticum monococcum subsp. monococcum TaxID=408188 RepID=C5J3R5_TRIMO|nr:trypsin inhibitor [Triticum monococcum subsp. monococcum]